jgi:8-oxo-dGTP diphosphatase
VLAGVPGTLAAEGWRDVGRPTGDNRRVRAIFFSDDDARAAAGQLVRDGWPASVERERLAGEDDDEDHPWAVVSEAPRFVLEMLVDRFDGWLDAGEDAPAAPPLDLPDAPRRLKRPPV